MRRTGAAEGATRVAGNISGAGQCHYSIRVVVTAGGSLPFCKENTEHKDNTATITICRRQTWQLAKMVFQLIHWAERGEGEGHPGHDDSSQGV